MTQVAKSMFHRWEEEFQNELRSFFREVESVQKIPADTIWKMWTGRCTVNPSLGSSIPVVQDQVKTTTTDEKKGKDAVKKSNYQVFFSIKRGDIMKTDPNASFGDISKKVSALWKALPAEEKQKYVSTPDVATTNTATTTTSATSKEKDVVVVSKKQVSEIVYSATTTNVPEPKGKRAKVEFAVADDDDKEDEDDFYFPEGSVGDDTDDNDDDDLRDDDDDLFGEED